ncbi:hypothetical protein ACIA58_38215 [Kribbella sp. NPDC051586]|uniref:hypothetical protein n=1 Tax=Kribbella sp. NPDC051586 TaxID=3364118 RepID=UPI0037BE1FBB
MVETGPPRSASEDLTVLGLSPHEAAVYEYLIDHHALSFTELLAVTTDRRELRDLLSGLISHGLVRQLADAPSRYAAIAPDVALAARLIAVERDIEQARASAREVSRRYQASLVRPATNLVELVIGGPALRQRVHQVKRSARTELRRLSRAPDIDDAAAIGTELALLQRAVVCRTVYDAKALEQSGFRDELERTGRAGGVSRVTPRVPLALCLVDDRLALLPLQRGPSEVEAGLVIHPSGLLDALGNLFEGLWYGAVPLAPAGDRAAPVQQMAGQDRLEALLLSGLKDSAVARQLGISNRSIQRQIAALLRDLGAATRFQAGVQAALRATQPKRPDRQTS